MFSLIIYLDIYFVDSNILRIKDTRWMWSGLVTNVTGLRDFVTRESKGGAMLHPYNKFISTAP
jgi:hypothetical protein